LPRILELRVGTAGDALDRFAAEGRGIKSLFLLTMRDLPLLLKTLSPARWALLAELRKAGPLSIYELARRLERNYKNVHTDVTQLAALGLIEKGSDNRITAPWDVLRAELSL
jgi:predicted transcriptional regulator